MWVDPWPWMDYLRGTDFTFGTRIHGNIAALLAGTPAYVLAHDTRTLELARYFEIPNRLISEVRPRPTRPSSTRRPTSGRSTPNHKKRFDTFIGYIERHGLRHIFMAGEDPTAFERKVAASGIPPRSRCYSGSTGCAGRQRTGSPPDASRRTQGPQPGPDRILNAAQVDGGVPQRRGSDERACGAPGGIRTHDPQLRKLVLYPLSYGRTMCGGEGGIRTLGAGYPTRRFSKPLH